MHARCGDSPTSDLHGAFREEDAITFELDALAHEPTDDVAAAAQGSERRQLGLPEPLHPTR